MTERDEGRGSVSAALDGITRRHLLGRAGRGSLALVGAGMLLDACGSSSGGSTVSKVLNPTSPSVPVASKGRPVTLPIFSDNKPIASGLPPEKGPLVIYDWSYYLSPAVVKSFEEKYGVKAQVTTFSTLDEAVNKINSGAIAPDVWVPSPQRLAEFVQAKLIQPINHSYIPNLDDVIPAAGDPWYDKGARYSTPNYINTFGVGWRNDLISIDPASLKSPWDVFWNVPKGTPMGLVNADPEDSILVAMLRSGTTSFDEITEKDVTAAAAQLAELKSAKWQYTAYQPLGTGVEKLALCFNGDMEVIGQYLQKGTPLSAISYYFPADKPGYILNDQWLIPKSSKNPVLGHLFMNHFLELQSAIDNFRDVGYQTMLKDLTIDKLIAAKVAPRHSIEMAFSPPAFQENGLPAPVFNAHQLTWIEGAFAQLTSS